MDKIDIDKGIKLSVIAGILLISFSVFYYFVIFLPSKEKEKNQQQLYKIASEKVARSTCQEDAINRAADYYKTRRRESPSLYTGGEGTYMRYDYEAYYKECLRSYGLDE